MRNPGCSESPPYQCPRLLLLLGGCLSLTSALCDCQESNSADRDQPSLKPEIHPVAALLLCSCLGLGPCPSWLWNTWYRWPQTSMSPWTRKPSIRTSVNCVFSSRSVMGSVHTWPVWVVGCAQVWCTCHTTSFFNAYMKACQCGLRRQPHLQLLLTDVK